MTGLWNSNDLVTATLGTATHPFVATGVSIDTRTLKQGDLFIAIKGENRDGHEYVAAALKAGAAAALVSFAPAQVPAESPLLVVANTQRALEDMGHAARARSSAKFVGVTGSAGKTTTKELLRYALSALGETSASASSFNNQWGVPLTLAAMPTSARFGVIEIGMNHFGEIRALVNVVRPHVALVTTIAEAHIEFFGSCEAIADAKSEIFEGLLAGGAALIPSDSPYCARLKARAGQTGVSRILTFGATSGSDARLLSFDETDEAAVVAVDILGHRGRYRIGAPGAHVACNAVAALAAVAVLGGDIESAGEALARFAPLKGRGTRFELPVHGGRARVIDESYNANPASMRAALSLLASSRVTHGGRRIAVLGDMLELGEQGPSLHAALEPDIEAARVDCVFACGPQMQSLWSALPATRRGGYGHTSGDIAPLVVSSLREGDVILVKGSLGSRMSVVIDALQLLAAG